MADLSKIRLSGQTYNLKDENALHTLDTSVTSGGTNAVNGAGIYNAIASALQSVAEQGYQTSGDVQNAISGKADTTAVTQSINEAVSGKADLNVTVTDVDFTKKSGANQLLYSLKKDNSWSSGKEVFTAGSGLTMNDKTVSVDFTKVAELTDIPAVSGYADAVKYNSTSKYVEFYHGGTGGTVVFSYDASPFLIDGMVDNVEIKTVAGSGTCLVITFNTDAGKQDINIPISQIFDATNYYTKSEVDTALSGKADTADTYTKQETSDLIDEKIVEAGGMTSGAVQTMIDESISGKADTSTVNGINNTLTAHTANTDIHVTTSDKSTWNGKQDALVSGTNIKTVGGNSLLGSGNIAFPEGMTARVGTGADAETLIFEFN